MYIARHTPAILPHQELEQGYAPYLEREIRGRHSLPRVLHYIAWTQAGVCTVFLLLLVSDSELHFARMPVQQEARQQQQQRCDKQQQGFSSCISSIEGTYQSRLTPALPTPKLSSKQCLPIMVCSMLSKSRSTASLYRNHCSHSSPGTHYSGLLPSCTIAAARYSLLLLDVLGLLLAVALLHLTWPRDVHTVVPAWAWVPNGVLPVNHQQLNGPWQAQHGSSGSGDVHNLGQGIGTMSLSQHGLPSAATAAGAMPAAAGSGHWFAVTVAADTWVSRRSRWIDAGSFMYMLLAAALTWVLLSQ